MGGWSVIMDGVKAVATELEIDDHMVLAKRVSIIGEELFRQEKKAEEEEESDTEEVGKGN